MSQAKEDEEEVMCGICSENEEGEEEGRIPRTKRGPKLLTTREREREREKSMRLHTCHSEIGAGTV